MSWEDILKQQAKFANRDFVWPNKDEVLVQARDIAIREKIPMYLMELNDRSGYYYTDVIEPAEDSHAKQIEVLSPDFDNKEMVP